MMKRNPHDPCKRLVAVTLALTLMTGMITSCSKDEPVTEETTATTAIDGRYVRIVEGVEPEMMTCDYWIGNAESDGFDIDKVLMDEERIADFNKENRVHITANDGTEMPFLDEIGDTLDGDILRNFLNGYGIPDDPSQYYLDGEPTTREFWEEVSSRANKDAVPDTINVRFGYTVSRATLRLYPTEARVFDDPEDRYFDCMLFSECLPYLPVAILHESTDGEYYYAVFDSFAAWVRKDAIALCKDRDDWVKRKDPEQVLTVTGREIRLGDDPYCEATKDLVLPIGTHMELVSAEQAPESINQRTTYGDYIVRVPTRGDDGYIKNEYVLIPMSDDVTVGYLPYTSRNVVKLAFKLLGDRYGWGGDLRANDCSGIVREIYNCFGIVLPRVNQTDVTGVYKVDMSEMSDLEKLAEMKKMLPGSLFSFPGHIMIYLGMVGNVPYVISAVGTFVMPAPASEEKLHPDSVVINSLYVRRASLVTWLESIKTAVTIM